MFETNGSFRLENVLLSPYDLHIHLSQREEENGGLIYRSMASLSREVVGPDGAADLQLLQQLHQRYGPSGQLLIIGLNVVDGARQGAEQLARSRQIPWPQCHVGPWTDAVVPALFGVDSVPVAILIGPDGTVRHKNLRGPALVRVVTEALESSDRPKLPHPE